MRRYVGLFGAATVAAGLSSAQVAAAAEITQLTTPIDFTSKACTAAGDFVSCSAPYLNVLAGLSQGTTTDNGGYVLQASQGLIKLSVVVGTGAGGQIPNNSEFGSGIDNAFDTPNNGNFSTVTAPDPTGSPAGDTSKSWDIELSALINALTINDIRHQMLIMFDHNQQGGTGLAQSLDIWALVSVRDLDGNKPTLNYELNSSNVGPTNFTTTKTFEDYTENATSDPLSSDFVTSAAVICLDGGNNVLAVVPPAGSCPAGTVTEIDNNLGTNKVEFINGIPELDAQLEALLAAGYDTISVRYDMLRNNGGYEDIFIIAGQPLQIPEPATLLTMGVGLLGLAALRRRNKKSC